MRVSSEFSKYAGSYGSYNVIQTKVAKKVVSHIKGEPQRILDLGCGSGALYKELDWTPASFMGIDFAKGMLELHPKSQNIVCRFGDFNSQQLFDELSACEFDYILSSSALQWADDLEIVFRNLAILDKPLSLGIFTSNTFKTVNDCAGLAPMLRSVQDLLSIVEQYLNLNAEVVNFELEFESNREIFKYIKQSGVSGSRNMLSYKETKRLIEEYPKKSLEFEVLFLYS
ncbi:MAG: methyltransferase domain-containing protein [Epsilonproteobacteria bacterium]|nr:methyltransferase domain-containing protein [Campylobacterota bacterium]